MRHPESEYGLVRTHVRVSNPGADRVASVLVLKRAFQDEDLFASEVPVFAEYRLVVAWQARVDGSFSPLPEPVLQAIATIPSYRGQVDAIRTKHLEVLRLRAELPLPNQVSATLERITAAVVAKDDAWRHLSGSGIPDEVIDFLRQAGTSGFSLAKLTPAIQAWLGERDLLGTFRIPSA